MIHRRRIFISHCVKPCMEPDWKTYAPFPHPLATTTRHAMEHPQSASPSPPPQDKDKRDRIPFLTPIGPQRLYHESDLRANSNITSSSPAPASFGLSSMKSSREVIAICARNRALCHRTIRTRRWAQSPPTHKQYNASSYTAFSAPRHQDKEWR